MAPEDPPPDDPDYRFVDYGDSLVGVMLGHRFPPWGYAGARATCKELGIVCRRVKWDKGRPVALTVK
jgi:hypothetical protein